jgi:hypothetical protein
MAARHQQRLEQGKSKKEKGKSTEQAKSILVLGIVINGYGTRFGRTASNFCLFTFSFL